VRAYDPVSVDNARRVLGDASFCDSPYAVAEGADALILMTEWNEFKHLDMRRIARSMRQAVMVDTRNVYDPSKLRALRFKYRGVGRGCWTDSCLDQDEAVAF